MKIIVVDDHPIVRKGIISMFESEEGYDVCGEAEDGNSAIKLITEHEPDCVIIDVELKGNVNGIELVQAISERFPKTICLVMSMDDGTIYAERSIRAGAKGFIAKEEAAENLLTAINAIMSGKIYLSADISQRIAYKHIYGVSEDTDVSIDILSNRELEIFQLISKGYKRGEIAKKLNTNINTVESHRRKIREKLNIPSASELAKIAVQWNIHQNKEHNQDNK